MWGHTLELCKYLVPHQTFAHYFDTNGDFQTPLFLLQTLVVILTLRKHISFSPIYLCISARIRGFSFYSIDYIFILIFKLSQIWPKGAPSSQPLHTRTILIPKYYAPVTNLTSRVPFPDVKYSFLREYILSLY